MKSFFECNVSFREEFNEKDTKQVLLIDALSFTESEANIIKYLDGLDGLYIISMAKVYFDDIIYQNDIEEYSWYESKVKMKSDSGKDVSFKYLFADSSVKKATSQLLKYLEDSDGETRITLIKEKQIDDIILRKTDENFPDEDPIILSFEEHKDLSIKLEDLKHINSELKKSLGVVSLSYHKYKVLVGINNSEYIVGKTLAKNILKTWTEDFVDEDTGDVVQIERNEVLIGSGTVIEKDHFIEILNSKVEYVILKR